MKYGVIGDVPFLNGGLFEESELDRRDGIAVPDEAIGAGSGPTCLTASISP